jgi:pyruvate-ferredoxin/flavodoxin oxidoreductase
MAKNMKSTDGNNAATHVAYAFSEVAAIYPITPSSGMGELADAWAAQGRKNIFGQKVEVVELQSEGGASGAVHGSLSAGALTTTFTASQGLMLMLPNMHKIAGEMLPTVFHVSARSLACQSLSIFGDHSDVMSARNTGWALMAASSIQEIMDLGVVSHLTTLKASIPFLNFFDGFRNSHEIQKINEISYATMAEMLDQQYVDQFRKRAMNPENPRVKVGQENPDVYFQGRETVNKYYQVAPEIVQEYMDLLAQKVGRQYHLFDYFGAPDAEKIIVIMGSGADTVEETIDYLNKRGEKVGLIKVRLYRPFAVAQFVRTIPASVKKIAVLDRTKEPGAIGEPLYLDVVASLMGKNIQVIGGRYGLSSKEFTPSMVKAVYDHLDGAATHNFTVGIVDDVTHTSLEIKEHIYSIPEGTISCKFWGLGSDGTVGANKNSIKIIGDNTDMYAQGYFQYDSKKSGGITRSHLRFGKYPIKSEYLVTDNIDFVACHNQAFIGRYDVLEGIKAKGVFLLNSIWSKEEVFEHLTEEMQQTIIDKKVRFYNIDALAIARNVGLGGRINTVMMAAFFIISGVLEKDLAIKLIKNAVEKTYHAKGREIVEMNWKAIDATAAALVEVQVPAKMPVNHAPMKQLVPTNASAFVKNVIEKTMREKGDEIPVSQMPLDGYVPSNTAKLEKRGVAPRVPHWLREKCIQCNQCSFICPHAAIRPKLIDPKDLENAPDGFVTLDAIGKDAGMKYRLQIYIEDCQSCMNCVNECPKEALIAVPIQQERDAGETTFAEFFDALPSDVLTKTVGLETIKGSQFKQPLLEFSGACAGCGETPYIKVITQLVGDRMIIANATGCSSIWGGTFPTIPYAINKDEHGPTWANSLFEDNAEYGFGMRLAVDSNRAQLRTNIEKALEMNLGNGLDALLKEIIALWDSKGGEIKAASKKLKELLPGLIASADAKKQEILARILNFQSYIVPKSVWAIGGDGWAYDIGFGGLDHVMASNRNVNILVLDTEVYSNTGGQASKATPLGSVARFAEAGKTTKKKDLGLIMMSYGYVYVASVAMGASKVQLLKAIKEADDYQGPAIIIAYAPCINHGCNLEMTQAEEKKAVDTGYWILYRYNPLLKAGGKNPLTLDSRKPSLPVEEFLKGEKRYTSLKLSFPDLAEKYWKEQQIVVDERYEQYRKMAE